MNVGRLKAGAEYVGGVLIATFFVVLLSYIFSFLGTIFCAALGGMMLGAMGTKKSLSIPISLIFPLVIFGLVRGMKAEVSGRQMLVIAVACFSVFWLAYAVARALFLFERRRPAQVDRQPQAPLTSAAKPARETSTLPAAAEAGEGNEANEWFSLDMLEGNWSRETSPLGRAEKRRMSIENDELTLTVLDSSNRIKVLARVTLKVGTAGSVRTLLISKPELQADYKHTPTAPLTELG